MLWLVVDDIVDIVVDDAGIKLNWLLQQKVIEPPAYVPGPWPPGHKVNTLRRGMARACCGLVSSVQM